MEMKTEHIGQGVIKRILHRRFPFRPSGQVKQHLNTCDRCRALLNIVHRARKAKGGAAAPTHMHGLSKLELADLVVRAYDQSLSPQKAALFLHAIESTEKSFDDLAAVVEEANLPLPEEAEARLARLSDISIAETVLAMIPTENASPKRPVFDLSGISQRMGLTVPRLAYAAVAVAILLVLGWGVLDYYKTDYKVTQATELLAARYRVFYKETPRLSGDYGATAAGRILGGPDQEADEAAIPDSGEPQQKSAAMLRRDGSYLKQALRLTEEAIANGETSPEAKRLQAQIFIIHGQLEQAKERLTSIPDEERTAAVFNDLGVLNFEQRDLQKAATYFEAAIQADRTLKEAYYNLALVQKKRGLQREAEATVEDYLKLETNEDWQLAARGLVK